MRPAGSRERGHQVTLRGTDRACRYRERGRHFAGPADESQRSARSLPDGRPHVVGDPGSNGNVSDARPGWIRDARGACRLYRDG
jgi:hypothetical protein